MPAPLYASDEMGQQAEVEGHEDGGWLRSSSSSGRKVRKAERQGTAMQFSSWPLLIHTARSASGSESLWLGERSRPTSETTAKDGEKQVGTGRRTVR